MSRIPPIRAAAARNKTGRNCSLIAATGFIKSILSITAEIMVTEFDGTIRLVAEETDAPENTSAKNLLKMINLLSTDTIEFMGTNSSGVSIQVFKGTMPGAYANIQAEQGIEKKSTESILDNRVTVLANTADARDSVTGVNLDEEVMNLMRYQQSYSAAARLMTVMDEALDKLINNTGVVGR